jgi:hypothetical protein
VEKEKKDGNRRKTKGKKIRWDGERNKGRGKSI